MIINIDVMTVPLEFDTYHAVLASKQGERYVSLI